MIELTLGHCVDADPALSRLAAQKLPFAGAYRIAKLAKAVADELRHFQEQRNALVTEYGSERPAATPEERAQHGETVRYIDPTAPDWWTFVARLQELAAVPVSLPLDPIDLTTVEGLEITAADLLQLGALVTANGNGSV